MSWLGSDERKRAAWSMHIHMVSAGRSRSGAPDKPAFATVQGGRAIARATDGTWGGIDGLSADAFLAEEDVREKALRLKDSRDDETPGVEPWLHDQSFTDGRPANIRRALPLEALVVRAAKVGPGLENEHVYFPGRGLLISHHRSSRKGEPPSLSTPVSDPGDGDADWEAGLHGICRVRPWVDQFCDGGQTAATPADGEEKPRPFALLLNYSRSTGDLSGYGAAHFARGDALLSDEGGGPTAAADDGNHEIAHPPEGRIMQGGLNITRMLLGDRAAGILYSPVQFVNEQWPNPPKGPLPNLVEFREDFNDRHRNYCGRMVPGRKKWVSWDVLRPVTGPPRTPIRPPDEPPGDPPGPPKIPVPILPPDEPGQGDPGMPGGEPWEQPPSYGEEGDPHEGPSAGGGTAPETPAIAGSGQEPYDDPWGGYPPGEHPPSHAQPPVTGEEAQDEPSAETPEQLGAPSFLLHARPALPDGRLEPRDLGVGQSGPRAESDSYWGLRYGLTHEQDARSPDVADIIAVPEYENDTPANNDDPNLRWQPRKSRAEEIEFDGMGLIAARKRAQGPGVGAVAPSGQPVNSVFVERKHVWQGVPNRVGWVVTAGKNAAGQEIPGMLGLGLLRLKGGIASGLRVSLAYDGPGGITSPDVHLETVDQNGAADPAARIFINGAEAGAGGDGSEEAELLATEDGAGALHAVDMAVELAAADGVLTLDCTLQGWCIDDGDVGAPAFEEAVMARMVGTFKVLGGIVTQLGATQYPVAEGDAGWADWMADIANRLYFDIVGTTLSVNVAGMAQDTAGDDASYRFRSRLQKPQLMEA